MPYQPNPGHLPAACLVRDDQGEVTGYRPVHVRLWGGLDSRKAGHAPWPSGGARVATDWTISKPRHPFQIEEFDIA